MTVGDLICQLLKMPYDRPVEVITMDGEVLSIAGMEHVGWGVRLIMEQDVQSGDCAADLFNEALGVVKAVEAMRKSQLGEAFQTFDKFGDLCEVTDQFIDQYVHEEDLK